MNCHKIRAAIELSSPREPLHESAQRHLVDCQGCRQYADELRSLIALLNAPPRVSVPADFDFRLRARIAAAQVQQHRLPVWLESFWTLNFSWGQAARVMAAVAVVVASVTVYLLRQQPVKTPSETNVVARSSATPAYAPVPPPELQASESTKIDPSSSPKLAIPTLRSPKPSPLDQARRNDLLSAATPEERGTEAGIAGRQIIIRNRGGELQMVTVSEYTFGAQGALARSAVNPETAQMTQVIF